MKPLLLSVALLLFTGAISVSAAASSPSDGQIGDVIERIIAEEAGSDIECRVSCLDLDGDGAEEVLFRFPVGGARQPGPGAEMACGNTHGTV